MMRGKDDFPIKMTIGIFVFTFLFSYAHGISDYSDLPAGVQYCAARYKYRDCCPGREDECSAPILDTTCYCDDFCNRTHDDCCPDYWSHCKGMAISQPITKGCEYKGRHLGGDETIKDNCNTCKCNSRPGVEAKLDCEQNRCLVEEDILRTVDSESSRLGWRAENHTEFWGRTLTEGITLRLGTLNPSKSVANLNPVRRLYNPGGLPRSFDSREHWANRISEITDQGWCGASWALSAVDVASDRFAIMSKGREAVTLSAQHLLSCNNRGQQGCKGGYLDRAWMFMRKYGLVDEECYQWTGESGKCRLPKRVSLSAANCHVPIDPPRNSLYKVGPSYRLGNETDIMQEIMTSGPVQATMKVYQDFFVYKSGVYKHSAIAEGERTGYHSVRIIGWGEELSTWGPPVKYWVVANSWGRNWGEGGFFRIVRGVNECEIETFVLGAWAKPKGINYK